MRSATIVCTSSSCVTKDRPDGSGFSLHLDNHRENHWSSFRLLEEELADLVADAITGVLGVGGRFWIVVVDGFLHLVTSLFDELLMLLHEDEAAADDVWVAHDLASLLFQSGR